MDILATMVHQHNFEAKMTGGTMMLPGSGRAYLLAGTTADAVLGVLSKKMATLGPIPLEFSKSYEREQMEEERRRRQEEC